MKKRYVYFLVFFLLFACNSIEKEDVCNSDNPFEIPWLKEWIAELQHCACIISVFQAEYQGETVFWKLMNDPLCQGVIQDVPIFNCTGQEILVLEDYQSWINFTEGIQNSKIIYACSKN